MEISMDVVLDCFHGYKYKCLLEQTDEKIRGVRWMSKPPFDAGMIYVGDGKDMLPKDEGEDSGTFLSFCNSNVVIYGIEPYEAMNIIGDALDFYQKWSRQLEEAANTEDGLQKMIDFCYGVIRFPLFIYDNDGHVLAISEHYAEDLHWQWKNLKKNRFMDYEQLKLFKEYGDVSSVFADEKPRLHNSPLGDYQYVHCNILLNGQVFGHLVVFMADEEKQKGCRYLTEYLQRQIERHLCLFSYVYETNRGKLDFTALLDAEDESGVEKALVPFIKEMNWCRTDCYQVALIREIAEVEPVLLSKTYTRLAAALMGCYPLVFQKEIVLIMNQTQISRLRYPAVNQIRVICGNDFSVGYSDSFDDLYGLRQYYYQVKILMESVPVSETGHELSVADYGLDILLKIMTERREAELFVSEDIKKLHRYDKKNHTQYYRTLACYIRGGCQISETSRLLNIHRNTISNRIAKIQEMVTFNVYGLVDQPRQMEWLNLSYAIYDYLNQIE